MIKKYFALAFATILAIGVIFGVVTTSDSKQDYNQVSTESMQSSDGPSLEFVGRRKAP